MCTRMCTHTHRVSEINDVEVEGGLVGRKKGVSRVGRERERTEDSKGVSRKCIIYINENVIINPLLSIADIANKNPLNFKTDYDIFKS